MKLRAWTGEQTFSHGHTHLLVRWKCDGYDVWNVIIIRSTPKIYVPVSAPGYDIDALKREWDRLPGVDWNSFFKGKIPKSPVEFWLGVVRYDNVSEHKRFSTIIPLALRALTIPISNACVERAFSFMNAIKGKTRNKMESKLLEAIMRIRMKMAGTACCRTFEPSPRMLELFNVGMYAYHQYIGEPSDDEDDDDEG